MLRKDIVRATGKLLQVFQESGVYDLFDTLMRQEKMEEPSEILGKFTSYVRLHAQFGNVEKQLLSILDLDFLHSTDFWTMLMTAEEIRNPQIYRKLQSLGFARDHLPKFISLMEREYDRTPETKEKGKKPNEVVLSQLSVTIIEDRQQSTPERLILVLQSIDGLYGACAQILSESEGDLCVIACDSGSDKSFDFLGVAKIVECVKGVILSFWDRVVYYREDKTERRLELVAQSLPILAEVASMKESGKLEPERAELIKRQVIDSVTKFARAGVTIPEIENFTVYNPRQLMRPEPKLLVAPKQVESEGGQS